MIENVAENLAYVEMFNFTTVDKEFTLRNHRHTIRPVLFGTVPV